MDHNCCSIEDELERNRKGSRRDKSPAQTTVEKVGDAGRTAFPKLFSFLPSLLPSPRSIAIFELLLCVNNALVKGNTPIYGIVMSSATIELLVEVTLCVLDLQAVLCVHMVLPEH